MNFSESDEEQKIEQKAKENELEEMQTVKGKKSKEEIEAEKKALKEIKAKNNAKIKKIWT